MPPGLDPVAKEVWNRLAPIYVRLGMLTEIDGEAFTALCEASAALTRIRRAFRKGGYKVLLEQRVLQTGKDETEAAVEVITHKVNPLLARQGEASRNLRFWCNEFGATPSSRGKINVPTGISKGNKEEDFLDG
jgi:P27 family predicted phage terminase small subunit